MYAARFFFIPPKEFFSSLISCCVAAGCLEIEFAHRIMWMSCVTYIKNRVEESIYEIFMQKYGGSDCKWIFFYLFLKIFLFCLFFLFVCVWKSFLKLKLKLKKKIVWKSFDIGFCKEGEFENFDWILSFITLVFVISRIHASQIASYSGETLSYGSKKMKNDF